MTNARERATTEFWHFLQWLTFGEKSKLIAVRSQDALSLLIKSLEVLCEEFKSLIERADVREQELQSFLEQHIYLISPDKKPTLGNRKVGHDYLTDFTLIYEDNKTTLVELQLNKAILNANTPSRDFQDALTQMKNWFAWLSSTKPSDLTNTDGLIIIGRKKEYEANKLTIDKFVKEIGHNVKLLTYDDLKDNIKRALEELKSAMKSQTS